MGSEKAIGYAAVCLGAIANGSFSVPLKLCRRKCPGLPDPIFQAYWALAVGVVSLLTIPIQCSVFDGPRHPRPCFEWESLGIAGALACALATACVFVGVRHLGVALPPSLYAGTFIAASATEDLGFLGKTVDGSGLFVLALALIFGAVLGVAAIKIWSSRQLSIQSDVESPPTDAMMDNGTNAEIMDNGAGADAASFAGQAVRSIAGVSSADMLAFEQKEQKSQKIAVGVVASLAVGVFGSLTPFSSIKAGVPPFAFVASFGIATPLVHLVLCPLLFLTGTCNGAISSKGEGSVWDTRTAVPYALLSGGLWALGNIGMNFALTAGVDFAVAASIYQCGLLVSGLWGIFLFKEMTRRLPILLFFCCGIVLIAGIALESIVVV